MRIRLASGNTAVRKKLFFYFGVSQKSARAVLCGMKLELEPRRPILEKCSHLQDKGGVLPTYSKVLLIVWR
jgi:hypothetical protein